MHKWFKLSLAALVGAAFIALLIYVMLMKDVIRSAQVEPPLILALDEPVKRHPDQPGGMMIPDQDKLVFDLLDEGAVTPVAAAAPDMAADEPEDMAAVEELEAAPEPEEKIEIAAVVETPKVAAPVEVKQEAPVVAKAEPDVAKEAPSGAYGVQLGSVRVKADAEAALKKLANQYAVLKPLSGRVQAAEVKGSTSYRIQFIGVADRDAAAAVCAKVKPQACFPVAK